ncbi:MAG TPA: ATP-NAD kinase family protein [Candidatus Thermoplasmatota archaeon]|nr:ATP-NAD kinase family protein [Candidatus Thermoplasmatota archaeon]
MRRIGLVVNPIAGLGGAVGLKGTDGKAEAALRLGARARAHPRAVAFLRALPEDVTLVTSGGPMGDDACAEAEVSAIVVHTPGEPTRAIDTVEASRAIAAAGVDLLVFVGGDGSAADVARGLEGTRTPALGVPAGVKMYSAVFADTPEAAAIVATTFDATAQHEVLDIDEEAFRRGELKVAIQGALHVPGHARVQAGKVAGEDDEVEVETLAQAVVESLEPGRAYVLGAGTTMLAVKQALGIDGSLLGLDVVRIGPGGATLLVKDARERDLLDVEGEMEIVLSPIGSQGFFLGRGNLPVTPAVLSRVKLPEGVRVVATPWKLLMTPTLKVDTGDAAIDRLFPAYMRVLTGHGQTKLMRVVG